MNTYITDRQDFKLKVCIKNCERPSQVKNIQFIREEYNDKNDLTNTSTYDFFLNEEEIAKLWMAFANGVR